MKLEVGMSEELKLLFEDLHKNELSKVGKCNLNLIKQLQAYKDKEDKLRELLSKNNVYEYNEKGICIKSPTVNWQYFTKEFLQILNEGDK